MSTVTGNSTIDELLQLLEDADRAADIALPLAGLPEFAIVADVVNALLQKIAGAIAKQTPPLAAEIAGADAAAVAAEVAAGLK